MGTSRIDAGAESRDAVEKEQSYFVANCAAPTIDSKIFMPSVHPSTVSLARSGCGIIPKTFLRGLQIPAILSRDPLGFASAATSPAALE